MKELIRTRTGGCLVVAAIVFAMAGATSAAKPAATKDTASVAGANSDNVSRAGEDLASIQARAKAAARKLATKDASIVKQVNTDLTKVRADLEAYAKTNGLKIKTETYTHPPGTAAAEQSCPGAKSHGADMKCTLVGASVDKNGALHCQYECVVVSQTIKQ